MSTFYNYAQYEHSIELKRDPHSKIFTRWVHLESMKNVITHNKHQLIGDNILISPYRMVFNMYTTVHHTQGFKLTFLSSLWSVKNFLIVIYVW